MFNSTLENIWLLKRCKVKIGPICILYTRNDVRIKRGKIKVALKN